MADTDNLKAVLETLNKESAPGVDRITVEQLAKDFDNKAFMISSQIINGVYRVNLLRRVFIPKKNSPNEQRMISIPTTQDKLVQAAIVRVLYPLYTPLFSVNSFGFIKGKGTFAALDHAIECANDGYKYAVKLDIRKFFDTVPHDKLMKYLAEDITNQGLLKLIYQFVKAKALDKRKIVTVEEGVPQGGPLSPLLTSLYLNRLDDFLIENGYKFTRYVDDCIIHTKSQEESEEVFVKVKEFIEEKLFLKINLEKSYIKPFEDIEFLGYCFTCNEGRYKHGLNKASYEELKSKVEDIINNMNEDESIKETINKLNYVRNGWLAYYAKADIEKEMLELDIFIYERLKKKKKMLRKQKDLNDINVFYEVPEAYKEDSSYASIVDFIYDAYKVAPPCNIKSYKRIIKRKGYRKSIQLYYAVRDKWARKDKVK